MDLFDQIRLGYLVVESNRLDDWRRFGAEALGLHVDEDADGGLAFRLDHHQRRLMVRPGPAEDVAAIGLELSAAALAAVAGRLQRCGRPLAEASADLARQRGVSQLYSFIGPKDQRFELYVQACTSAEPLAMRASGFVTGAAGMGHVAITSRAPEAMLAFWHNVFDARLSDTIEDKLDGIQMDFSFLHLNERHHTVAVASTRGLRLDPIRTRIHHLNLQMAGLDDVTDAYVRCRRLGYSIANAIGQHPNDRELSFYVVSPSGFEIELGWRPLTVNGDWRVGHYHGVSLWGHFPENLGAGVKLRRAGRALRSLLRPETSIATEGCRERHH